MTRRWLALVLAASPVAAMAQDGGADPDAFPLTVKVGQVVSLCATGTIVCPAGVAICDDPSVAVPGTAEGGLVLRGVKPGKTLCSARSAQGLGALRLYRVEVVEAKR